MLRHCVCFFVVLTCVAESPAAETPAVDFQRDVQPVLKQLCFGCHGEQKQEASLRLDRLNPDLVSGRDGETWHDVLNRLNLGEMPPEKSPQPTAIQRKLLVGWLTAEIQRAEEVSRSTGGRVVMRRLTRYEYNNTMRDLLGLNLDFAKNLPPEPPSKDGFRNNGAALGISPLQIEYYLQAARDGLGKAIVTGPQPQQVQQRAEKSEKVRRIKGEVSNLLGPDSRFLMRMNEFPREGEVLVRVHARAQVPPGLPWPQMRVTLGLRADTQAPEKTLATTEVNTTEGKTWEFRGRIEEFPLPGHNPKYPGLQVSVYNASAAVPTAKGKKPKKNAPPDPSQPLVAVQWVEFVGPVYETWPPQHHQRIFVTPTTDDEREYATEILRQFMKRAYRRPVTDADLTPLLGLYDKIRPQSESLEETMRDVLAMVLVSPEFLYLVEPRANDTTKQPLTQHELAARLSFFLWSSLPDDRLTELADTGKLAEPAVLQREVKRLLADEKSRQFVNQFTDQWLDLSGLDRVAVNPEYYPTFDESLKQDMRRETQLFFAEILDKNLSCLNLIDSDFAMLNSRLAEHYGLAGPRGVAFERVALAADSQRGGLLTQGSFLLRNSNGEDSHPIKRAVWLLDRLLDDPPAPPPPDVPDLDPEKPQFANLTLKEQLEAHRERVACNNCHRGIDPWGVAFENFDAVGQWRTKILGPQRGRKKTKTSKPVDALALLPNGTEVNGATGLQAWLLENRKEEFARTLVKRLLTYSLGRSLELGDRETVDRLTREFRESDYRLPALLAAIVTSQPFLTK